MKEAFQFCLFKKTGIVVQVMVALSSYVFWGFAFKTVKQNQWYQVLYYKNKLSSVSLSPFQHNLINQEAHSSSNLNAEMYWWNWWICENIGLQDKTSDKKHNWKSEEYLEIFLSRSKS